MDSIRLTKERVAGRCEHDNQLSDSVREEKDFLGQQSDC